MVGEGEPLEAMTSLTHVCILADLFAEVNNTKGLGPAFAIGHFDGICGMGWDDISVDGVTTPLRALVNSGKLAEQVFAFYLAHEAAGELTLGGVDPAHYSGDFNYVPVAETVPGKTGYWALAMDDIQIGGTSVTSVRKAIVDSGTSLLAAPSAEIKAIAKLVGAHPVLPIPPVRRKPNAKCAQMRVTHTPRTPPKLHSSTRSTLSTAPRPVPTLTSKSVA